MVSTTRGFDKRSNGRASRFCDRAVDGGLFSAGFVSGIAAAVLDSFLYSLYFSAGRDFLSRL